MQIINSRNIFYVLSSLVLCTFYNVKSQDYSSKRQKIESASSLMGMGSDEFTRISTLETGKMMIASVDEEKYKIDAGDVFILKVDVKGPAFKIFNSVVTPDGYLVIPDAPTVYVRHLSLNEAKIKINRVLKKSFPEATVESHLYQVHPIRVNVLGAIPRPGKITLNSSDRLFDAVSRMIDPFLGDTTIIFNRDVISFRNVEIRRKIENSSYDLLNYKLNGDRSQNPYLLDEDIIYINFRDSARFTISVSGAVSRPVEFEYKKGDKLITAIRFASALLPTADSTRVELVRFDEIERNLQKYILSFPSDSNFILKPDDRIYVREKVQYHEKFSVFIEGEVKYPGEYAIENGETFLSEIIEQAGGFTQKASLSNSTLQRNKSLLPDDGELKRLENVRTVEMNREERSYSTLRTRENRFIVTTDFEMLFIENNKTEDVLLFDQDLIIVPQRTKTVFVSGGVTSPGNITFKPEWTFEDYIEAAGGFSDLAREGWVTIIDSKTGKWKDADDDDRIKEGDIIFVPERNRLDWYRFFRDGLSIIAQVSTILLVVATLSK
jgi:protein involved in polysaccharide export with SLBB domain